MRPQQIVEQFNKCINRRDIEGLVEWMTEDHVLIDSENNRTEGLAACRNAWEGFFRMFPDYRNHFERLTAEGDYVHVCGFSTCTAPALDGPALWTARIRDGRICEWRVHEDSRANRERLGLSGK